MGPGLVTGASDDDPSGIATYSQAGAAFGLSLLWSSVLTLPLLIAVQEMCARIALVTGKGLLANIQARFSRPVVGMVVLLLVTANTLNLGADIGMMAASARLIVPLPNWLLLMVFTAMTLVMQICIPYATYAKYLKWLTLSLLAYILVGNSLTIDWGQVFTFTFIPHIQWSKEYWLMFVALLGTTISPYLYFWQTNQTVEEERLRAHIRPAHLRQPMSLLRKDIPLMRGDVTAGMIISNMVAWFIILTAGLVLHTNGIFEITSADQAARVLAPFAGQWASLIFAVGIIGTGLLAVPVLSASAAYALSEFLGVEGGLSQTWKESSTFYGMIIFVTFLGLGINIFSTNPVRALIISAVCNALIAAPILFCIIRIGSDKVLMKTYVNQTLSKVLGWTTFFVMGGSALTWFVISVCLK